MSRSSSLRALRAGVPAGVIASVLAIAPLAAADRQHGRLTVWSTPAAFDDRARGAAIELRSEDFESSQARYIPGDHFASCIEPVSQRSDDACFMPGDLVEGVRLKSSNGYGVIVMGTDLLGASSLVAGGWPYRLSPSSLNFTRVEFDHGPTLVAADVYGFAIFEGSATGESAPVTVEAFDAQGQSLGSFVVQPASAGSPAFAGFSSAEPIAMVEFGTRQEAAGAMIDNLRFGGGVGRPEPDADALHFGVVPAGAVGVRALQVRNAGSLPLSLLAPAVGGPFALAQEDCSQSPLPGGASCTVWLSFEPGWIDDFKAAVALPGDYPGDTAVVLLEGTGVAAEAGR
jgi:hypothetical protein